MCPRTENGAQYPFIMGHHAKFWDPVGSFGNPRNDFLQNGLDFIYGVKYCALVRTKQKVLFQSWLCYSWFYVTHIDNTTHHTVTLLVSLSHFVRSNGAKCDRCLQWHRNVGNFYFYEGVSNITDTSKPSLDQ